MKKLITLLLLVFSFLAVCWAAFLWIKASSIKETTQALIEKAKSAEFDQKQWRQIAQESKKIPNIYPTSLIRSSFLNAEKIVNEFENIKTEISEINTEKIRFDRLFKILEHIEEIQKRSEKIQKNIKAIPSFFLSKEQKQEQAFLLQKLIFANDFLEKIMLSKKVLKELESKNQRILILLQNPNEPRSTGGFTGSILLLDSSDDFIEWSFSDIYALDRRVPRSAQLPAPEFFHDLSQTISLRDANFFPNFETSARLYQQFFKSIDEKVPTTIIGINISTAEELLRLTGPIHLNQWGITVNQSNVDLALQFLVGSQIAGRYEVKKPIVLLIEKMFSSSVLDSVSMEKIIQFDAQGFKDQKNILAYSENKSLQKIFKTWNITGAVEKNKEVDNFLYFDFISTGANKSEKFVWTKINHNSFVSQSGTVQNTLKIKRTHALQPNEIEDLLNTNAWMPNIKELLTGDMRWVLGEGENRTLLRIFVPLGAQIKTAYSPSGDINQNRSHDGKFTIFEVPLYVNIGETIETEIQYETKTDRGNYNFRPYYLQVVGTPGRKKTEFLATISTEPKGTFTAETQNIGAPQPLIDQNYRALIEYERTAPEPK